MYARYFGLSQPPFSIAPDPRYLFMSERHREALAHLLYGVRAGGGFVVLTGEIGAGKTTVCRSFLEQIPERCEVAYIFNPKLTVEELLASVCAEFRIPFRHEGPGVATVKDYVDALNAYLLRTHAVARDNVLIIDEAQSLSPDVLEQLRLLTNLETNERKLLQIVLIGQPELRAMLARPGMEQLGQRVIARYHLDALREDETVQYVRHRLAVAGLTQAVPFDDKALRSIYRYSRGVPRRINLLCDRALLGAYAKGSTVVDRRTVDAAAKEVLDPPVVAASRRSRYERAALLGLGLLAGAALVGALAFRPASAPRGNATPDAGTSPASTSIATATTNGNARRERECGCERGRGCERQRGCRARFGVLPDTRIRPDNGRCASGGFRAGSRGERSRGSRGSRGSHVGQRSGGAGDAVRPAHRVRDPRRRRVRIVARTGPRMGHRAPRRRTVPYRAEAAAALLPKAARPRSR